MMAYNDLLHYVSRASADVREAVEFTETERGRLLQAIKDAYGPHTLQEIGDAAGLSRQRVEQLIKKETP